ncbi:peptidase M22 glycoprotease [Alicyclobacillus hesperidum URH17-3-68]|uniref:tRNA (Adenosine(37)-N6)-threonylcarbamoyltransferase complex dimerization subunit type 1 TsaB n=1 Tax=Alicyclobacillus hesperidum TaxID=89784 RepID=A0A1H2UK51_9BACL|nr:tRNA (adenosine(37)-N6)-threonylcarbamoyltransferase complex dimerization subunit type 1 TsaB [Alicyclobacillus hesperidum]EJY54863.1 peptidase M22 glycoprotease [Alicyclobacillus hesperidum URH17-3-68]GLV14390.1 tRNA (adenosine(37)-N6)-threonylcarbamoyltransferase complex dimerization subunit type 1 TsaB [Alicyclobacillus hesperidum]SDW56566.1 tRNA threonylcarbamoyladenosine biosynthesis protein TsaB [Alicyclobacillus hesperidum]
MGVIAMDTATDTLAVGAGTSDGRLLSGVIQRVPRGHSRLLQPSVQFALASAGLAMTDVERIVTGVGPGSYTGVRMAVATAKAMGHALRVPVVAVPTLDAMARAAVLAEAANGLPHRIVVMLNARRGRAFGACYTRAVDERFVRDCDIQVLPIASWLQVVGDGEDALIVHDLPRDWPMPTHVARSLTWGALSGLMPQALLELGKCPEYAVYTGDGLHALAPVYALLVEAEAKWQAASEGGST